MLEIQRAIVAPPAKERPPRHKPRVFGIQTALPGIAAGSCSRIRNSDSSVQDGMRVLSRIWRMTLRARSRCPSRTSPLQATR